MGKKQRHKQQPSRPVTQTSARPAVAPVKETTLTPEQRRVVAAEYASSRSHASATWAELSQQYRHVNAELKEIGIIAGSFLVVLLILTAVLS
ncbi:MAG: hypothetical protein JXA58_03680 [Dehalococcoidia bacterium]|nr:hypothetical protein [Dehalococcoidia bacterium]